MNSLLKTRSPFVLALLATLISRVVSAQVCDLYPMALSAQSLSNVAPGVIVSDIFNGTQPGGFGWLTWGGSPSESTLVTSLTSPGNSGTTYVNPDNPADHQINAGDWIQAKPGVSNSRQVRDAMDALKQIDITVPVWSASRGQGANAAYRVSAFARVRLISYQLPGQNRITARFLGYTSCDVTNLPPIVNAGPDQTIQLPSAATLSGSVADDGLPAGGTLTSVWTVLSGPGTVTFGNVNSASTTAAFSDPGTYVLSLSASDSVLSAADELVVTVNRANQPPVGDPLAAETDEDAGISLTLAGSDPDGDPITFRVTSDPVYGTLSGTAPNLFYEPKPDWNGSDSFTFVANDGLLDSPNATVSITVRPINDPPVADSLSLTNLEDTLLPILLSGSDVEGSPLTFTIVAGPASGTLNPQPPALNSFTYVPPTNYFGTDSFTFKVNDGTNDSALATVTITTLPIDDLPLVLAGPDQTILLPTNTVDLNGLVIDDIFPGAVQFVQWTGPPSVTFADPSNEVTTATFSEAGIFTLQLTAGNENLSASDELVVIVNGVPLVNAGADQTNTLPAIVTLNGSVTDDGVPSNTVTVAWSKVSGPGTVVFSDPAATNTAVSFSEGGVYLLKLTANDGIASASDEVSVMMNEAPLVDAGSDQVVTNLSAELAGTVFDDGLPSGIVIATWTQVSGPGAAVFSQPSITNYLPSQSGAAAGQPATSVTFSQTGEYELELTATDSLAERSDRVKIYVNAAPVVSAGTNRTIFITDSIQLDGSVTDDGLPPGATLRTYWTVLNGPGMMSLDDPFSPTATASFSTPGTYVLRLTADDTSLMGHGEVTIVVRPINYPPSVYAGGDQITLFPNAVLLQGAVTDDGEPAGSTLATAWSKVSGPGGVTFSQPPGAPEQGGGGSTTNSPPVTQAAFSAPGVYVLRLAVTDSELSAHDDVTVIVHQGPSVDAGPDLATTVTNPITLNGVVTDDGLPFNVLNVAWSKVSGPGVALFAQPGAAVTDVQFTAAGYYVLRLSATDSNVVSSDDVLVTVRPPGENMAPFVDAGTNQLIGLTNVAVLRGTVADDGLPFGAPVAAEWSVVSGPGNVTFSELATTNSQLVAQATFSAAGAYVLRLTANDTELTSFDDVTISIYPDNQPPIVNAGPDQTLASGPITLTGTVSDDGRPLNTPLALAWSVVSGPGSVTFANSNSPITTATFSEAGAYTLLFSANDSQFTVGDSVVITLTGNQAPIVNAGPDQVLDLIVPFGAAASSTTLYPSVPDQWISKPSQPGLGGSYGTLGSIQVAEDGLYWSGQYLFVSGGFRNANGVQVNSVARWDGCGYSALFDPRPYDPNNPNSPIIGFISGPNGRSSLVNPVAAKGSEAYVAGGFLSWDLDFDGSVEFTAKWNGSNWVSWHFAGTGAQNVNRGVMLVVSNDVYFGGMFRFKTSSLPAAPVSFNLAKWDGTNWVALGEGVRPFDGGPNAGDPNPGFVRALAVASNGTLYAGGTFIMQTPTGFATNLAKWDGTNWSPVSPLGANAVVESLAIGPDGDLYAAGGFGSIGGVAASGIARWNGTNWFPLGSGMNNVAKSLAFDGNDLIVGGLFTTAGGVTVNRIARWNGTNWSAFPGGGLNNRANALATTPQGIFAGGTFSTAGGKTANLIALFGQDLQATLTGPDPITVSNAPSGGATVPVTLNVSHPCGNALTLTWNVDGGVPEHTDALPASTTSTPVPVTFTNFYTPGVHTLVATLTDGTNAPIIFSTTVTVLTPAIATLNGSATDDGLPINQLIANWSLLSGPASVFFSQPSTTNAQPGGTAAFTAVGTFTIQLAGDDSEFTSTDTMSVSVRAVGNSNRPPAVSAGPDQFIALDEEAPLNGMTLDDNLPVNQLIATWTQVSGPGTASFAQPSTTNSLPSQSGATAGQPVTAVTFSEAGSYVLRLTADDTEFTGYDEVTVTVSAQTNAAPVVDAGPDQTVTLEGQVMLAGSVTDDGLPFGTMASEWEKVSGPGTVLFRLLNGTMSARFGATGVYVLRLNANDGRRSSFDEMTVTVLDNLPGPFVEIVSPVDGAILTAPTIVTGTVSSDILQSYALEYRLAPPVDSTTHPFGEPVVDGGPWTVLATGNTTVANNALGTLDPTLLLNGIYQIRLTATDTVNRTVATEPITVIIDRNLKIGHFTLSFSDLTVPVAGVPIEIVRTYDSRDRRTNDFGVGWSLDIRNVRVQKNRSFAFNWFADGSPATGYNYSFEPFRPRIVTLTFPDGRVHKF